MKKPKAKFSHPQRVIKTDLDSLEIEHAKYIASASGTKSLPYSEIHHDPDTDKYHLTTRGRDTDKEHHPHTDETMDQGRFTSHVVELLRNHPKMQPFPKEARVSVNKKGHVDVHIGHPDYKR